MWTPDLRERMKAAARAAGFSAFGVAEVPAPEDPQTTEVSRRFEDWIASGLNGEMGYLAQRNEDGNLVRSVLQRTMPWARSVAVCAWNYNAEGVQSIDPAPKGAGWIARYAWMGQQREDGSQV